MCRAEAYRQQVVVGRDVAVPRQVIGALEVAGCHQATGPVEDGDGRLWGQQRRGGEKEEREGG